MKDLVIYGAGGFGRETAWLIQQINRHSPRYHVIGFCDDGKQVGEVVDQLPVLGGMGYLNGVTEELRVAIAIADPTTREKIRNQLTNTQLKFPTLVHPSVVISEGCRLGQGSIICADVVMTVDVSIGSFVIVNLKCTLGHDSKIEQYSSLMPSVNVSGNVSLGRGVYVGAGAILLQGVSVGNYSLVGAGAVVNKSFDQYKKIMGVPARAV